jgi:hypothetical protein
MKSGILDAPRFADWPLPIPYSIESRHYLDLFQYRLPTVYIYRRALASSISLKKTGKLAETKCLILLYLFHFHPRRLYGRSNKSQTKPHQTQNNKKPKRTEWARTKIAAVVWQLDTWPLVYLNGLESVQPFPLRRYISIVETQSLTSVASSSPLLLCHGNFDVVSGPKFGVVMEYPRIVHRSCGLWVSYST